jgi:hypothetical protein
MEKDKYKGSERRSFNRIQYNPKERPKFQIKDQFFEVADISEKGLSLVNDKEIYLDMRIRGKLTFLSGESVDIEGSVLWEIDNVLGVQFENLIPSDKIIKEQRHLILNSD